MEVGYYVPELEEFHVGFEYEIIFDDEIVSRVFDEIEMSTSLLFATKTAIGGLVQQLRDKRIRVKYLNQFDIESLGFEETNTKQFIIDAPGKLGYWTEAVIDFRWKEDISIIGKRGDEVGMLFRGNIKNKSELKKLLKQLSIL